MTDERWRIATLQAMCLVALATVPAYEFGIYGLTFPETPPIQADQVQQVPAEQAMSVDPHHAEYSNLPSVQGDTAERDEKAREALQHLYDAEPELDEALKRKDELDEIGNQAPDPVNQAEVRPPPGQECLSTPGPVEVSAGPYPVQDPRLTALDFKHAADLRKLDDYTKRMEESLKSRYEGSTDLDGYLKSFGEIAEKQRESRLNEQVAERQQLEGEAFAEQQRTFNEQQQYTSPMPPPIQPDLNRDR